jgi:prepilin-type N-terminal cleavage/methylation domain-containing protein
MKEKGAVAGLERPESTGHPAFHLRVDDRLVKRHTQEDESTAGRYDLTMCQGVCERLVRMVNLGRWLGFTVIEILIVLVVIAIAAMVVVPLASSAASMQIRSAASMVAADLEYAKSMAISRGQNFSVVFDTTTESYRIENQDGDIITHPVKKGSNYVVDFRNDSRLDKVDIANVDFDTTGTVKFDYLGSPYNGSGNPLNSGVVNLQAGGMTITVNVEPVTGFISITD